MNQDIRCDVQSCKYQDGSNHCSLHDIQVSNTCSDVKEKRDTGCMSFENSN